MCRCRLLYFLLLPTQSQAAAVNVDDLTRVIPGAWSLAGTQPFTRTNLPAALAASPTWTDLPACVKPQQGYDSTDIANYWMSGPWLPENRSDLVTLRTMEVRTLKLRHCDLQPAAERSLRVFLDRAWTLGLRVVLGIPQRYFFDLRHGCAFTNRFDCHDTIRELYQQILSTELVDENGNYHPALETILLLDVLDDVIFAKRCNDLGFNCTSQQIIRAAITAWDGILKAEREFGVDGSNVRVSMPFSAGVLKKHAEEETNACYKFRAPGGCAGANMMRRLWAATQDFRLVNVVVVMPADLQYNTTLEGLRSRCGPEKDLVSIRHVDHVEFIQQKVEQAGVDMTREAGVLLGYDYHGMNRYFDLRNKTRDITNIFIELWARGVMTGDFHLMNVATQRWMAGFGWGRSKQDVGIADWSHKDATQAIVCESLYTVGYYLHHDLGGTEHLKRWMHTFRSEESSSDVTFALRDFYSYAAPNANAPNAVVFHFLESWSPTNTTPGKALTSEPTFAPTAPTPEPTASPTLAPTEAPVMVEVIVNGIDYNDLASNSQLTGSFKTVVSAAIREEFDGKLAENDIQVTLSQGSVIASITIIPSADVSAISIKEQMQNSLTLVDRLVTLISEIKGISAIKTSSDISVVIQVLTGDPTAPPTTGPTTEPTTGPTSEPSSAPTLEPSLAPTAGAAVLTNESTNLTSDSKPSSEPTLTSTSEPISEPTVDRMPENASESAWEVAVSTSGAIDPRAAPSSEPAVDGTPENASELSAEVAVNRSGTTDP